MNEAQITINGVALTEAQSMTLRVAMIGHFNGMSEEGALGPDETGETIRKGYLARSAEIINLLHGRTPPPATNVAGIMEALREALEPFADQSEFWSDQVSDRTPLLEKDNLKVGDVRRAAKAVDEYRRWKAAQAQPAGTVAADQNAAATSRPPTPPPAPREVGSP